MPRRCRSVLLLPAAVALVTALAACGSQLDPETVSGAGAGGTTVSGSDGSAGDDSGLPGTDTGGGSTDTDGGVIGATDGGGGDVGGTSTDTSGDGSTGTSGGGGGGGGAGGGGSSGGGEGGSGDDSGGPGDDGGDDGDGAPAVDPDAQGSCDGFKNQTGITDDKIILGNSSDISGPVPGLFEQSQDATRAFIEYFNATTDGICGRKLELKTFDSKTDAGADQQAYTTACDQVFAMVGSMSAFDSGGAATAQRCGVPDIRSAIVTSERDACTTCFGAQSIKTGETQNAAADFILENYGDAGQHAAFLYINAGASAQNAPRQAAAMDKRGLKFDYVQPIDVAEFNYTPFVQQMKDEKIEVVFWTGAASMSLRLRQTMLAQGYEPTVYMRDPTDYTPEYTQGGEAVDGTVAFLNFVPFEEASSSPEMSLYLGYLQQTKPGAAPGFFGVFSWSATRLFVDKAAELGGKLTRTSLIDAVRKTDNWTGRDIHSKQHVGSHRTGDCFRFLQLDGSTWKAVGGRAYRCKGTTQG